MQTRLDKSPWCRAAGVVSKFLSSSSRLHPCPNKNRVSYDSPDKCLVMSHISLHLLCHLCHQRGEMGMERESRVGEYEQWDTGKKCHFSFALETVWVSCFVTSCSQYFERPLGSREEHDSKYRCLCGDGIVRFIDPLLFKTQRRTNLCVPVWKEVQVFFSSRKPVQCSQTFLFCVCFDTCWEEDLFIYFEDQEGQERTKTQNLNSYRKPGTVEHPC